MTRIRAEEIVEEFKKERLKEGFKEQHKGQFEKTDRLIRSPHAVAKKIDHMFLIKNTVSYSKPMA